MRTCSIPGCAGRHYSRGWCHMHYSRWYKHGDPLTVKIVGRKSRLAPEAVREIRAWYTAVQSLPMAIEMARKHQIGTTRLYAVARGLSSKGIA
jgi:hypothetical protein